MTKEQMLALQKTACRVRMGVLDSVFNAKSGHPGGSLSVTDTLVYLYFCEMNVDPADPHNPGRDRLVLSKGHTAPALYAVLAEKGFFPKEELVRLRKPGAMLQGHPDMKGTPGIDMSTGSLGQGFSTAAGMALAARIGGEKWRVYAILGDGEIEEGQVWEAAMFAGNRHLDNLVAVVDNNNLQIDGTLAEVNSPNPITDKFAAFGWNVLEADAHDFASLEEAFTAARNCTGKPTVIVQHSVKGKGVSYMENKAEWHGTAPKKEQYDQAITELTAALAVLEG